ncbi:alcohol dehydrogenase catalytic domain-containing protein [Mycolicibacter arupensis]|jgi:NADPH:quinone reductase-like Zn-dependent oxidoreductase|uniref:alcohol dehydrogenase catalytic domain-containing protein n=1 Tax=Mycolicibacter arupensis TaxID=342002 RepID=UPI0023F305E0|nr:hypothetical protein [Mycolicibacter arupensis]
MATPEQPAGPAVVREAPGGSTMQAIILDGFGGLDALTYAEVPKPLPRHGEVVIRVKGFGINHAEMHMRRGEWAEAAEISGIECVGIVDSCPGGEFPVGAKVAALMGGLGRTINGSYAQFTRVRVGNVALIESDLSWDRLAALPETYATAWTSLFRNLNLTAGQTIVIRGATSSFGQAAVKLAVEAGARVIATTRSRERFGLLESLGAARAEREVPDLGSRIAEAKRIDAVLDELSSRRQRRTDQPKLGIQCSRYRSHSRGREVDVGVEQHGLCVGVVLLQRRCRQRLVVAGNLTRMSAVTLSTP